MSFRLTRDSLDKWLADFDEFRYDFLWHAQTLSKAVGYSFDFDQKALETAHANWKNQCEIWQRTFIMPGSNGLSHLKILAILLCQLAMIPWIRNLYPYTSGQREMEFAGSEAEKIEVAKDLNAAREAYLAFQFVFQVLNWQESVRTDRNQPFVLRMTPDLEHDLLVYLVSGKADEIALFLILKALYARDPKPGATE
jgi:hypothetical protein